MTAPGNLIDLYCRLSPYKKKTDKVMSIAEQEKIQRRQAKDHGYVVRKVWVDDGITAFDDDPTKRPAFVGLCAAISADEVDCVGAVRGDRFARDNGVNDWFLGKCAAHGVKLLKDGSITDPGASPAAMAMAQIEGVMGEMESAIKKQRILDARQASAEKGRPHPGARPFGYNPDRRTLHPVEAPLYRELFDRSLAGDGFLKIGMDWESRGILNRNGRRFSPTSLRDLLEAPRVVGLRVHRGKIMEGVTGDWEPIVSIETQRNAVAASRARRRLRTTDAPLRPGRLLSAMVVCGSCENPLRVRYGSHATKAPEYGCDQSRPGRCGSAWVKAEAVEAEVEKRFLARLRAPATLRALDKLRADRPDVSGLLDEVERLQNELETIAQMKARKELTLSQFQILNKDTRADLDAARERLDAATDAPVLLAVDPAKTLADWQAATPDEKRRHLSAWIERVRVDSAGGVSWKTNFNAGRVHVDWRF